MDISRSDVCIVDCTLRDGGYYNAWDFDNTLVNAYLSVMSRIPVDIIELGFRTFDSNGFHGPHAYTTDAFIETLNIPANAHLGVMLNAKDIVTYKDGPRAAIDAMFCKKSESRVEMVRIAAHARETEKSGAAVQRLHELGYRVGFNLMQAGEQTDATLKTVASLIAALPVEVLYFADSLGNMDRADIARVINAFRGSWHGPLGVHTHDNICRALDNSVAAVEGGVTWIDGTVLGMGRGPGNVRLELLLLELQRVYGMDFNVDGLIDLVSRYFLPMQQKYNWGPSPFYFLSGVNSIHPTYVQDLLSDGRYQVADIIAAMNFLGQASSTSYRSDSLRAALRMYNGKSEGTWSARDWANGRPILLVASGPSLRRHMTAIKQFIEKQKPLVVALNLDTGLPRKYITAWAACHPVRLAMDAERYAETQPLIAPLSSLPKALADRLNKSGVYDFALNILDDSFQFWDNGCKTPSPLVAAYCLALAASAGAPKTYLVGFDGFDASDPRQAEMLGIIERYQGTPGASPLIAITPTTYPVTQSSVYNPAL